MMENIKFVWLFVVLALGVGVALGVGITGNVIRPASSLETTATLPSTDSTDASSFLSNCELVRDQDGMNFGPSTADGIFRNYACPVGKKPISTSVTWSSYSNPSFYCDTVSIDGGEFYDGMAYSIVAKDCIQDEAYEVEWSMVCCNGVA